MEHISLEGEVWKDVVGYEGLYKVSNLGRIYSCYFDRINKISICRDWGYGLIGLSKKGVSKVCRVHRLCAIAFLENKENKEQVNHKNGIKLDNRIENLEWCTNGENQIHAYKTGLKIGAFTGKFGSEHNKSKTTYQFDIKGNLIGIFGSASEAARFLKKSRSGITDCCLGKERQAHGYVWKYTIN